MAQDLHTVEVIDGSTLAMGDRVILAHLPQQAYSAGGGAGQVVTLAVTGLKLPAKYSVLLGLGQDATGFVTARTQTGFTVNIEPRLAANTLSAGSVDILVVA
jgi:hypothetical protein